MSWGTLRQIIQTIILCLISQTTDLTVTVCMTLSQLTYHCSCPLSQQKSSWVQQSEWWTLEETSRWTSKTFECFWVKGTNTRQVLTLVRGVSGFSSTEQREHLALTFTVISETTHPSVMFSGGWFSSLEEATTTSAPKELREESIIFAESRNKDCDLRYSLVEENNSSFHNNTQQSVLFTALGKVHN